MKRRAVFITALPIEMKSVLRFLSNVHSDPKPSGTIYEVGDFDDGNGGEWFVHVAQIGMGNVGAAIQTERAINELKPEYLFFVGVSGGVKDVSLGDVVVADKIYGYESGKDGKGFLARPSAHRVDFDMIQLANKISRDEKWIERTKDKLRNEFNPSSFVGPIASGEKVVSSTKSATFKFIKSNYGDTLSLEMEGKGFLEAVWMNPSSAVKAIVVRGVSDMIDKKSSSDSQGYQAIASICAAAFSFEMLSVANQIFNKKQKEVEQEKPKSFEYIEHLSKSMNSVNDFILKSNNEGSDLKIIYGHQSESQREFNSHKICSHIYMALNEDWFPANEKTETLWLCFDACKKTLKTLSERELYQGRLIALAIEFSKYSYALYDILFMIEERKFIRDDKDMNHFIECGRRLSILKRSGFTKELNVKESFDIISCCISILFFASNAGMLSLFTWIRLPNPDNIHTIDTMTNYPVSFRIVFDDRMKFHEIEYGILTEDPMGQIQDIGLKTTMAYNNAIDRHKIKSNKMTINTYEKEEFKSELPGSMPVVLFPTK